MNSKAIEILAKMPLKNRGIIIYPPIYIILRFKYANCKKNRNTFFDKIFILEDDNQKRESAIFRYTFPLFFLVFHSFIQLQFCHL